MSLRVVTVPYRSELGRFDDAELCQLATQHTVVSSAHHLVVADGAPHLVFVLGLRPRGVASSRASGSSIGTAAGAASATAQPEHAAAAADTAPLAHSIRQERPNGLTAQRMPREPDGKLDLTGLSARDREAFEALRRWRYGQATSQGVPPYVILTNRNLFELVRRRPGSISALTGIHGIGRGKAERYGAALLALFADAKAEADGHAGEAARPGEEAASVGTQDEPHDPAPGAVSAAEPAPTASPGDRAGDEGHANAAVELRAVRPAPALTLHEPSLAFGERP